MLNSKFLDIPSLVFDSKVTTGAVSTEIFSLENASSLLIDACCVGTFSSFNTFVDNVEH